MNHNCDRAMDPVNEDDICGKPARFYRRFQHMDFVGDPGADVHTYYYCSVACAVADTYAMHADGYDPVSGVCIIVERRAQ